MKRGTALTIVALVAVAWAATPAEAQQPTHKPGGYHSPEIQKDQSWSHVFNTTGVSFYHCHPHPFMQAKVEVNEGASTSPVTIEIRGFKFNPETLVVGVGTQVTWVNRDAAFHTVDESMPPADGGSATGGNSPGLAVPAILLAMALAATTAWRRQPQ